MGKDYVAEGLLAAFGKRSGRKTPFCCPGPPWPAILFLLELARRGAVVEVVEAYRTVVPDAAARPVRDLLGGGKPGGITFTSSSTVRELRGHGGGGSSRPPEGGFHRAGHLRTARELGIDVAVEASVYTVDGLVDAILGYPKND